MIDDFTINKIKEEYELMPKDIGEYHKIDHSPMHFIVDAYDIKGVGRMSVMHMKAMLGMMKMTSVIITPLQKEMPLFSCDLIQAMGNNTYILELYQTSKETPSFDKINQIKEKYSYLTDYVSDPNWYDNIRLKETCSKKEKKHAKELQSLSEEYVAAYLEYLKNASAPIDINEKKKYTQDYVNTLIEKGGPAVNQFKKMIGEEKTAFFLRKYYFGSED